MKTNMVKRSPGRASIYAIAGVLVFIAIALSAGFAWFARTSQSSPAVPLEQVTIATNTEYVGTCPVIVAREKGYFANEGISAVVQRHTSGQSAMKAVLQGESNLATVADIPIVFAGMNNAPVSVVATFFKANKDHGVVGRRDRGVDTLAGLKGKRVGVTLGTSGHFVLDALLNRQLLSASDVTMRNLKPEEFAAALERGDIDAVATWQPYLDTLLKQLGNNGIIFYGEDVYEIPYNIAGKRDYISTHPETIKKIVRALIQGAHFCSSSPEASREMIAAVMKTDTATWKTLWPLYQFNVELDQSLVLALEDEARWAIKNKLTSRTDVPNYLNYIYLDALEAVAPSEVTIIH